MNTREVIVQLANDLILEKGFNAFSFHDLSEQIGIKTASIHYHFPTKTSLALAVVQEHQQSFERLKKQMSEEDPVRKLEAFFSIYSRNQSQEKVCLVGSLCTDLYAIDPAIEKALSPLVHDILEWVTSILKEGKRKGLFFFQPDARTQALMIITNMLGTLQVSRITGKNDLNKVKTTLLKELKTKTG